MCRGRYEPDKSSSGYVHSELEQEDFLGTNGFSKDTLHAGVLMDYKETTFLFKNFAARA